MDITPNGTDKKLQLDGFASSRPLAVNGINGHHVSEPSIEKLEMELPVVHDGQVSLGELLSRVAQAIYAELVELAETWVSHWPLYRLPIVPHRLPNMSDSARKRSLAGWVVKTKKQVVKLYAIMKWARDADTVQKCMVCTDDPSPRLAPQVYSEHHRLPHEPKSTVS